ncbi:MAG: lipoprotein-releasing ABC transporter permease subunit [Pseudomonadota bacterium]|jgi:lipoprotein-releasing system permease protein
MSTAAPMAWRIARRYLRPKSENGFLSFIAVVGVAGVALGVAVLLVVLGVMNGFESELKDRILAVASHATITSIEGPIADWQSLAVAAQREPGVLAVAPYVEERALVAHGRAVNGVLVRGIDPAAERLVSTLDRAVRGATLEVLTSGAYRVLLGKSLAADLGVKAGDLVVIAAPHGVATPAGVVPRLRRFRVAGTIDSGLYEFDHNVALIARADGARLFRTGSGVTGLRLRLDDPFSAPRVVRRVAVDLGGGFYISDWTREHANFFRSIATTKSIMFVLLLLVMAVAAFNIVATLTMLVREKRSDIAILRTMGVTPRTLMATFVLQGSVIGVVGTGFGLLLGILVATNLSTLIHGVEGLLRTTLIDPRVYLLDELVAQVTWGDVVRVCGTSVLLSILSTLPPAASAARTQPAEALRHD